MAPAAHCSQMNLDACDKLIDDVLASTTEAEFCYRIHPLLRAYEVLSVVFGRGETIFWRARVTNGSRFEGLSALSYPPAPLAGIGRLNDAGVPAFYATNSIHTALREVEATEGQLVQVAGFRLKPSASLSLILVGEYANVQQSGYVHTIGTDPGGTIKRLIREYGAHAHIHIYIDKFLSEMLNDRHARDSNYGRSRALGSMLHTLVSADGITFPSVRDPGGINVAVRPPAVDESMQNVACLLVRMGKSRRFGMFDHELHTSAVDIDATGKFVWPSTDTHRGRICIYGVTREEYMAILASNPDPGAIARPLSHSVSS